jgi:hypothetical protein
MSMKTTTPRSASAATKCLQLEMIEESPIEVDHDRGHVPAGDLIERSVQAVADLAGIPATHDVVSVDADPVVGRAAKTTWRSRSADASCFFA